MAPSKRGAGGGGATHIHTKLRSNGILKFLSKTHTLACNRLYMRCFPHILSASPCLTSIHHNLALPQPHDCMTQRAQKQV